MVNMLVLMSTTRMKDSRIAAGTLQLTPQSEGPSSTGSLVAGSSKGSLSKFTPHSRLTVQLQQMNQALPISTARAQTGMQVWAVEGTAHSILFYLDMPSIDAVLHFIQATPELHGYLQDAALWTNLSKLHFGSQRASELQVECGFTQDRGWQWASRERACVELEDFLQSLDDLKLFDETVTVLQDDIERIDNIDGKPLDGIAFPTGSYLMNPHTGAAGVVFRRAGHALDDFVSDQSFRDQLPVGSTLLPTGSAIATPAFNAGVSKLIHCVGPGVGAMNMATKFSTEWLPILGEVHSSIADTELERELDAFVTIPEDRQLKAEHNTAMLHEITPQEVIRAVASLNRHKAAGPDGLNNDFYKDGQAVLVPAMVAISNELLKGGDPPASFLEALIIPLKKKGDSVDAMNSGPFRCSRPVTRCS
jgi:hypothetical protein